MEFMKLRIPSHFPFPQLPHKMFTVFLSLLFFSFTQQQLASQTLYSGVTYNYNKYLKFDGEKGL